MKFHQYIMSHCTIIEWQIRLGSASRMESEINTKNPFQGCGSGSRADSLHSRWLLVQFPSPKVRLLKCLLAKD